ncbi:chitobiase/beta-hexosaminidase C-terminal domain-containing protein [Eubacterium barkeri]|uniref:Chitobiase/beta-hexosaminidase C-terminal domain-containing protein n=1 Tax=Eubacterium barkeri TaxID=1528 RepID=A0A1H3D0Z4_EUBBA|nr:chitobiase/beta-hexosaminidase C-terminal domain-containing protein [Eubacterium barkeri]SDX59349.1 Chitobiase/beta-hexosaminidase C-terminal domain-containing protein [Eubacterium barkeri]
MKKFMLFCVGLSILGVLSGCGDSTTNLNPPSYSVNAGTYAAAQSVVMNKPEGEEITIYYTTDGSDPTDQSTQYNGKAIPIEKTTTLKSIAKDKKGNQSAVATADYVINIPVATPQPTPETPTAAVSTTYENIGDISGRYISKKNTDYVYETQVFLDPQHNYFEYFNGALAQYVKGTVEYVFHDTYHPMIEIKNVDTHGDFSFDTIQIEPGSKGDGQIDISNVNGRSYHLYFLDNSSIEYLIDK